MSKPIIEAHPSLVIAYCPPNDKLLMSVYDAGYRRGKGPYVLTPNIIGGNPDIRYNEKAPIDVLIREVAEEFNPEFQLKHPQTNQFNQRVVWASIDDITQIRDAILDDIKPHQDFLVNAQSFAEGTTDYQAIYSYFYSEIPQDVIDIAESNLRRQKTITPEGLTGVFTLDELINDPRGALTTAHITAHALNYTFGENFVNPFPEVSQIQAQPIGPPRQSFQDYLQDFEYSKKEKPNHNNPEKIDPSFHKVVFGTHQSP